MGNTASGKHPKPDSVFFQETFWHLAFVFNEIITNHGSENFTIVWSNKHALFSVDFGKKRQAGKFTGLPGVDQD
jgi:hypothetical protein